MDEIDVTRKLRPAKGVGSPLPAPSVPIDPVRPAARTEPPAASFVPTPAVANVSTQPPVPDPDPVTGWLVVTKGAGRGRSLPLGYGVHAVGRGEDQRVSVRFGDKKISRRSHVEVSYDGQGRAFHVGPGRGSTPAYLNGQPVLQPAPLQHGDRITIGDTELGFVPFCGETFDWRQAS